MLRCNTRRWPFGLLLLLGTACGSGSKQEPAATARDQARDVTPARTDTRTNMRTATPPAKPQGPGGSLGNAGAGTPGPVSGAANPEAAAVPRPHDEPPGATPPTHNLEGPGSNADPNIRKPGSKPTGPKPTGTQPTGTTHDRPKADARDRSDR